MKKTVATLVALVFVLVLAAPTFAFSTDYDDWNYEWQSGKQGSMNHNYDMKMDGTIDLEKQTGHLCNTGAEWKLKAEGEGEMTVVGSTKQVPWKLTADNEMDWVTAPDAVNNLTVTSVIELCAPPKKEFASTDYVYNHALGLWESETGRSGEYLPYYYYNYENPTTYGRPPAEFFSGMDRWMFTQNEDELDERGSSLWSPNPNIALDMTDTALDGAFYDQYWGHTNVGAPNLYWDMAPNLHTGGWNRWGGGNLGEIWRLDAEDGWGFHDDFFRYGHMNQQDRIGALGEDYSTINVTDLTDQIWAVQVEAEQGMSGNLHQSFEAAYGPHEDQLWDGIGEDETVHKDGWTYATDADGYLVVDRGDDYIGNYFDIDQMARTSDGVTKRFIDISSPWSGAYLSEDMEVIGTTEIEEDFLMDNIAEGEAATPDWWDLF